MIPRRLLVPALLGAWLQGMAPGESLQVQGDFYGQGTRAVLLAHGGRFAKESWKSQALSLADTGFLVLALRFRGDTLNADGSPSSLGSTPDNAADVLAGVAELRRRGATTVFAVGASLGGDAVGEASARSQPGEIDGVVILGSSGGDRPKKMKGRKLFIVAHDDRGPAGLRLDEIRRHFAEVTEPKRLVVLEGSAHAQFLFATEQGPRVMDEILRFVSGS